MMPMLDCDAVMRQLWDYLDEELSEDRMAAIREHLSMCSRCQPQFDFERSFVEAMTHARREHPNPRAMSQRVRLTPQEQEFRLG